MKKFLTTCALVALIALPAGAAPRTDCAYSPRQTLVRDASDAVQISELIKQGVVFDETPRCGGTIMQLAVRRGNADVFKVLLEQDLKRANQIVSLDEFPIPDAPKKIPLWLFAAYYAPNENIVLLLKQALQGSNQNIAMTDDLGRNVLWYLDRNPVLRKTALYDDLNRDLLSTLTATTPDLLLNAAVQNNANSSFVVPNAAAQNSGNVNLVIPNRNATAGQQPAQAAQQIPNLLSRNVVEPKK